MIIRSLVQKTKVRGRWFGAAVLASLPLLLGFTFFQGFETGTDDWFPEGNSIVNSVPQPSISTSYNGSPTSVYANGVNAASGTFLGQVTSGITTTAPDTGNTCTIDTTGAIGPSLLCYGPATSFGLSPAFHVAKPFPTNGYTVQLAIFLDATYAQSHPDCSTVPCVPNMPGTPNTECVPGPDTGLSCEGSRFTWTVGLNDPTGAFHRDYVFQVGTAPGSSGSAFDSSTCPSGYVINAQYNSFRSGGTPYQGFETKCLPTSGWYTFKEVFTNVGGFLQVDWSILNLDGTPATCNDTTGTSVPCTWSRSSSFDPITSIGCPSYGWLADEEINDLPIDNTVFTTDGDCGQPQGRAQITPTSTTCQLFAAGTSATLADLTYTTSKTKTGSTISSVAPGVFFYYSTVTGAANDQVFISQEETESPPGNIAIQQSQAILYSSTCTKVGSLTVNTDGTASGTLPSAGTFIIGVKYTPSTLKGQVAPRPNSTSTYTYDTQLNGTEVDTATIDLETRPK